MKLKKYRIAIAMVISLAIPLILVSIVLAASQAGAPDSKSAASLPDSWADAELTMTLSVPVETPAQESPVDPDLRYAPGRLIVKFRPEVKVSKAWDGKVTSDASSVSALLTTHQVSDVRRIFPEAKAPKPGAAVQLKGEVVPMPDLTNIYLLTLPPETDIPMAVADFAADPAVEYAEPDGMFHTTDLVPNDPYYVNQWGLTKIQAPGAWDVTTGTNDIVIAVVDTGVDLTHPDLTGKEWTNPGETPGDGIDNDNNGYVDDVHGWDFVNMDNDPTDDNSHGTHVAGIAAANTDNATGIAGVCWDCRIMPVKVLQSSGWGFWSDVAAGIAYSADKGARVINLSLGGYGDSQTVHDAADYAYSTSILAAAAGNDGYKYPLPEYPPPPFYPAAYSSVLAVAATDHNDYKAGFSNHGLWVDVCAPGVSILSTIRSGGYANFNGTSMSSPFVSGLAALLASAHPEWSNDMIVGQLLNTTDPAYTPNPMYGWYKLGWGRINAFKALTLAPVPNLYYVSNAVDDSLGNNDGFVDAGETISLTLTLGNAWGQANDVMATIYTEDDYVTVHNDTASFGSIGSLATNTNGQDPYVLTISDTVHYIHDIVFTMTITASGGYSTTPPDPFVVRARSGTFVAGAILTDTIWTKDASPYIVTGNLLVGISTTLTISPGVVVKFEGPYKIQVPGTLRAQGTAQEKVKFTSDSGMRGSWQSIEFSNPNSANLLEHCVVEYGGGDGYYKAAVYVKGGALTMRHCLLTNNTNALYILDGNPVIEQNMIVGSSGHNSEQIPCYYGGCGIFAEGGNSHIHSNTITGNFIGLGRVRIGGQAYSDGNNWLNNGPYDIYSEFDLDATGSYWGTGDLSEIEGRVYHKNDDYNLGFVTYVPIATEPITTAPGFLVSATITPFDIVERGPMTVTLKYSRPMMTEVAPQVTFGARDPFTQNRVQDGEWISDIEWRGVFTVTQYTGDGINTLRVSGAKDSNGIPAPESTPLSFLIDAAGESALLLSATPGCNEVQLQWVETELETLAGYNLYRGMTNTVPYTDTPLAAVLADTVYTDTAASNGTTYYYQVSVLDTDMREVWFSNEEVVMPDDFTPPSTPVVQDDGDLTRRFDQIHATWSSADPDTGIVEYQYCIGTATNNCDTVSWTSTGTLTETNHSGLNLVDDQTYYVNVKARNGADHWSLIGSSDGISVDKLPVPTISAVEPITGVRTQSHVIAITGSNFAAPTVKLYNTMLGGVIVNTSVWLSATVPSYIAAGVYTITVTNYDTQQAVLTDAYTATNPAHQVAPVDVSPASGAVGTDESSYTVDIDVDTVNDLGGFQFDLLFDQAVVQVSDANLGGFLGSSGRDTEAAGPDIDNINGIVAFGAFSYGSNPGASGSGTLAMVTFTPVAQGSSALTLQNVQLVDTVTGAIPVQLNDGQVQVVVYPAYDFDRDCEITVVDIMRVASHWNTHPGDPNYDPAYDLDSDDDIDIVDIMKVVVHWGETCG